MSLPSDMTAWPRSRSPLPDAYQQIYADHMHGNRSGGSRLNKAALWLEEWMHRAVAEPPARRVLELGAGTLNHVRFERSAELYDVIEPLEDIVFEARKGLSVPVTYRGNYDSLVKMAWAGGHQYDKVVSVAVLEHLEDLPAVVSSGARLLAEGGVFAAGIPSEGGRLWELAWRSSTGRAFRRRYGLDYAALMKWEHINSAVEIEGVIRSLFEDVAVTRFPGRTLNSSVYTCIRARAPRIGLVDDILASRDSTT
jgi:SAM-dependent methyltransferase